MAKKKKDLHHRVPQSRVEEFGQASDFRGNVIKVCKDAHQAWHKLFGNMTPKEVIAVVRRVGKLPFTNTKKKEKAWEILFFGLASPKKVVKEVEQRWMGPAVAKVLEYKYKPRRR